VVLSKQIDGDGKEENFTESLIPPENLQEFFFLTKRLKPILLKEVIKN
jgi:hypothetical protein